jgi:hypothetical protein
MKKSLLAILFIAVLLASTPTYADSYIMHTVQPGNLLKIQPVAPGKTISILINGQKISTDQAPYMENDRVFVPIAFIAKALNLQEIIWDSSTVSAMLKNNTQTIHLPIGSKTATINGKIVELDAPINLYKGRTFVPIRFVAETFNCYVDWDSHNCVVDIYEEGFFPDDLYWLSRIVESEAAAEPFEGKLAVANVIINRKNSSIFPNTLKEVIFDKEYGFQFTPVLNGTIYNTPSTESIEAAKQALVGNNNIGDCMYFLNPLKSENFWIVINRTFYKSISQHDFYM